MAPDSNETVPSSFVERMLEGQSLLMLWREHRGLSVAELADMAGLPIDLIERIEAGAVEVAMFARALASALDLDEDDLL